MRSVKYLIICALMLLLVASCLGRSRTVPPPAEVPPEPEPEPVFVPEFSAEPIPPDVEARMRGVSLPDGARITLDELRYLRLSYIDFDGRPQTGEMVCNKAIADDLLYIFGQLYEEGYPIRSIRLVDDFGGSDDASMAADNTSCFNYRPVPGTRQLSAHALGRAVDINPLENPYVRSSGVVMPPEGAAYADRSADFEHKIVRGDVVWTLFHERGFMWGGTWRRAKDYQHFEK